MPRLARYAVAVVLAGLVGALFNAVAVGTMVAGQSFWDLATSPLRLSGAVLFAAMLPPIHLRFPFFVEDLVSLIALTIVPSLVSKFVFGSTLDWTPEVLFNAVYAAAALMTYRFAAEWGRAVND